MQETGGDGQWLTVLHISTHYAMKSPMTQPGADHLGFHSRASFCASAICAGIRESAMSIS